MTGNRIGSGAGFGAFVTALLVVAACGPLPRPFQPSAEAPPSPLVMEIATSGVWIAPIDGVSAPMSQLLVDSVADGLRGKGIKVVADEPTTSRYQLRGRAELNRADPSFDNVALIRWTLTDLDGRTLGADVQGVGGDREEWDYGSPRIIAEVGANVPAFIAASIHKEEETLKPVQPRVAGLWVDGIQGAPGDGNRALARAIATAVERSGIAVAFDRRHAEFVLDGRVNLGAAKDDLQRIEIVWRVLTQDGREIGRATQKNMVATGTFDGAWGEVAVAVADAAIGGIRGVLRAAGATRIRPETAGRRLETEIPSAAGTVPLPPPGLEVEGVAARPKKPGNQGATPTPPG